MSGAIQFEMTIGGCAAPVVAYRDILNPANGQLVGRAPVGGPRELDMAVAAASSAFEGWSITPDAERRAACVRISEIISAHAGELARLLTLEQGKPLKGLGAEFEVGGCAAWAAATAGLHMEPRVLQDGDGARIEMHRVPVGVVGSITPWNWPLLIAVWHIAPAVRAGATVVIKPSPYTPLGTLRLVELMNQVLPPGVLNAVSGDDQLGAMMSAHPGFAKLVFTGSIPTGKAIMRSAADTMKRLTLELGGNDAGIVLPSADPEEIAERVFWGAFINSGQTCAALKRLYVHDSVYDATCAALARLATSVPMGEGVNESSMLGPLQNEKQFRRVSDLVDDARRSGARVLTGGQPTGQGYFYPITLLADATDGMRVVDEEQFGPVLPIIRYSDVDDAVRRANGLEFGLGASVWGKDKDAVVAVARKLRAGTVYINKHADVAPHVPFGGIKQSGQGVEFGEEGLAAYTDIKIYNSTA